MMRELSMPLRRLQLNKQFPDGVDSAHMMAIHVTAIQLLTAVIQSLTSYIHYLTDSKFGIVFDL